MFYVKHTTNHLQHNQVDFYMNFVLTFYINFTMTQ